MMSCREIAEVTHLLPNDRARVRVVRMEACQACEARGSCMSLGGQTEDFHVDVVNGVGARPGDRVSLSLPGATLLLASAFLYLIPAMTLFVGAALGGWLAREVAWPEDPCALVGLLIGLSLGLLIARAYDKASGRRADRWPRLEGVVTSMDERGTRHAEVG